MCPPMSVLQPLHHHELYSSAKSIGQIRPKPRVFRPPLSRCAAIDFLVKPVRRGIVRGSPSLNSAFRRCGNCEAVWRQVDGKRASRGVNPHGPRKSLWGKCRRNAPAADRVSSKAVSGQCSSYRPSRRQSWLIAKKDQTLPSSWHRTANDLSGPSCLVRGTIRSPCGH